MPVIVEMDVRIAKIGSQAINNSIHVRVRLWEYLALFGHCIDCQPVKERLFSCYGSFLAPFDCHSYSSWSDISQRYTWQTAPGIADQFPDPATEDI
jgi:hypothetical protein